MAKSKGAIIIDVMKRDIKELEKAKKAILEAWNNMMLSYNHVVKWWQEYEWDDELQNRHDRECEDPDCPLRLKAKELTHPPKIIRFSDGQPR